MDGRCSVLIFTVMLLLNWTITNFAADIPPRDCPLECTCIGSVVKCTNVRSFPEGLPAQMTEFHLTDSFISNVPLNVFLNIPHLDRISLTSVTINVLSACSFGERENTAEILFKDVNINVMEGNAFSNLVNISKLWFIDSTIHEMKSFSIHGTSGVKSIKFIGTTIGTIHPNTFLRIDGAEELVFEDCSINLFLQNGLSRFEKIAKISILETGIFNWQCGSLEAFSSDVTAVSVKQSHFICDCNLAWVWIKYDKTHAIFDDSNVCLSSLANKTTPLSDMTIDDVCSDVGSRDNGCPRMLLPSTPHTCMRKFDTPYEPVEKIDYPKYFSRKPRGEAARLHTNALQLTFIIYAYIIIINLINYS